MRSCQDVLVWHHIVQLPLLEEHSLRITGDAVLAGILGRVVASPGFEALNSPEYDMVAKKAIGP